MPKGDCFPSAYEVVTTTDDTVLVHGIVTGAPGSTLDGVRYWHAWAERTITQDVPYTHPDTGEIVFLPMELTICIDNSQDEDREIPAAMYYNLGRIDPDETWRYTRDETYQHAARTRQYGPWVETPAGVR